MSAIIQRLIDQETKLAVPAAHLTPRANLFDLGLTSFDAIRLLVAIERAFKIEFPRESLKRETVSSIESIMSALQSAQPVAAAPDMRVAA